MPNIAEARCPACGAAPGCLSIEEKLIARPIGSFSLAGSQPKVSARYRPVLTCSACSLNHVGDYTDGGVAFPPLDAPSD